MRAIQNFPFLYDISAKYVSTNIVYKYLLSFLYIIFFFFIHFISYYIDNYIYARLLNNTK